MNNFRNGLLKRKSGISEKDYYESNTNMNSSAFNGYAGANMSKSVKANSVGPSIDDVVVSLQRASRRASKQ